jgi:hypothetical protein
MDRRNYVRSSTLRVEAEGVELDDGFGDKNDGEKTIITDSEILWCLRIIINIITIISRHRNNTGQKTTPG